MTSTKAISDDLVSALKRIFGSWEPTEDLAKSVGESVKEYLAKLEVENPKIYPRLEYLTYEKLFPKWKDRFLARVAVLLKMPVEETTQRWYHTVFPYSIRYIPALSDVWMLTDFLSPEDDIKVTYAAQLPTPHWVVKTDVTFKPRTAIEAIQIKLTISDSIQLDSTPEGL